MAFDKYQNLKEMILSKEKQKEFNNRMIEITYRYQKKYGFKISNMKNHETWNNEADAFKHAFGSALMAIELGNVGSIIGGIKHEYFPNNPLNEWNMDSWNNNQGRKIAEVIEKEYPNGILLSYPKEMREDIIAKKVMEKMRKGELITSPNDKRKYDGTILEKTFKDLGRLRDFTNDTCETLKKIF